jgi:hypothetical protein
VWWHAPGGTFRCHRIGRPAGYSGSQAAGCSQSRRRWASTNMLAPLRLRGRLRSGEPSGGPTGETQDRDRHSDGR